MICDGLSSRVTSRNVAASFRIPAPVQFIFEGLSLLHTYYLKMFLRIAKLVYYNVDFSAKRFKSRLFNYAYQTLVRLRGVIPREELIQSILPRCMVGVAPCTRTRGENNPDHLLQGTDLTTKIVDYISCGLPVVSTTLTRAFEVIERHKFGFCTNTRDEWRRALERLLSDDALYDRYSYNAEEFSFKYRANNVLRAVMDETLSSNNNLGG